MINWKEAVCAAISGIVVLFTIVFIKDLMCGSYDMDYSIILGQCVVKGK